ncbi:uncharacterized protein LDX57_001966 [Aspergillus melleus]|uniref:uncharacterized protein n=1 Tax=Aspergillus melleus TaxID=138277 RepID=UPI001E8EEE41|nr:uncharacterized protein LDX57_001966 [Aspergillus melleus]KAH8424209.1 hypothetical protein LDX57_001966 [Aspergillus melleus]
MAATDLAVAQQLQGALVGSVKVCQFESLRFDGLDVCGSRTLNQGNVRRLIHRFDQEGCRRLDPLTWIPAEMAPPDLEQIMATNSLTRLSLENPASISLPPGFSIYCFQGQHRLSAAAEWLNPNEHWWILCLYDATKLTPAARRKLRESEASAQEFSDGDIFRSVRYYQRRGEMEAAGEWLAKWSPSKCRDFKEIYQPKVDNHAAFRESLDNLLQFPALWSPWLMGLHLSSLKIPEELASCLSHINTAWVSLTCNQPHLLDTETVEQLEGRCPSLSKADRLHIDHLFDENTVFAACSDTQLRSELRQAALGYTGIIPSLRMFLENIKYIRPMVYVIKRLLPPRFRGTIRQTMFRYYVRPQNNRFPIQISESCVEERPHPNDDYGFWSAYRQVFLFAMRHFYGLSDAPPLGHNRYSPLGQVPDSQNLWIQFKELTRTVGLILPGSRISTRPAQYNPEFAAIYNLLTRLRPPRDFEYDPSIITQCSTQVAGVLQNIKQRRIPQQCPALAIDVQEHWSLDRRCGMTDIGSFFSDQNYLFLQHIYYPQSTMHGQDLSTFAVKRDFFTSFFPGFLDSPGMTEPISDCSVNLEPAADAPLPNEMIGPGPMTTVVHDDTDMSEEPQMPTRNLSATEQTQDMSPLQLHVLPALVNDIGSVNAIMPINQVPEPSHQELVLFDEARQYTEAETQVSTSLTNDALGCIKSQTVDACTYSTTLSPGRFHALFRRQARGNVPYGAFYHVDTKEILCLLCSSLDKLPDLLPGLAKFWFAKATKVPGAGENLKLLPVEDVVSFLNRGPELFFLGVWGSGYGAELLNIDQDVGTTEQLALPRFNIVEKRWELMPCAE